MDAIVSNSQLLEIATAGLTLRGNYSNTIRVVTGQSASFTLDNDFKLITFQSISWAYYTGEGQIPMLATIDLPIIIAANGGGSVDFYMINANGTHSAFCRLQYAPPTMNVQNYYYTGTSGANNTMVISYLIWD